MLEFWKDESFPFQRADFFFRFQAPRMARLFQNGRTPFKYLVVPEILTLVTECIQCIQLNLGMPGPLSVMVKVKMPLFALFSCYMQTKTPLPRMRLSHGRKATLMDGSEIQLTSSGIFPASWWLNQPI